MKDFRTSSCFSQLAASLVLSWYNTLLFCSFLAPTKVVPRGLLSASFPIRSKVLLAFTTKSFSERGSRALLVASLSFCIKICLLVMSLLDIAEKHVQWGSAVAQQMCMLRLGGCGVVLLLLLLDSPWSSLCNLALLVL